MAEEHKPARRGFLAGLGLAAAAGVAAKLSSKTTVPGLGLDQPATAEPEGNGYRLTEHIKKYYRTTTL